jgi:hypothetical protein
MDSDDVKSINPLQPTSCFETKHNFFLHTKLKQYKNDLQIHYFNDTESS